MTEQAAASQGAVTREAGKELLEGCTAKVIGLKGAPQHNGCHGVLRGFDSEKGRWGIKLASDGSVLGIKPDNLLFVRAPAGQFDEEDEDEKISRLKRKFDKVCKKYKLTGEDTASEIADLLTGGAKGIDKIGPSYFMERFKMEEPDAESFLAWIKVCMRCIIHAQFKPHAPTRIKYALSAAGNRTSTSRSILTPSSLYSHHSLPVLCGARAHTQHRQQTCSKCSVLWNSRSPRWIRMRELRTNLQQA